MGTPPPAQADQEFKAAQQGGDKRLREARNKVKAPGRPALSFNRAGGGREEGAAVSDLMNFGISKAAQPDIRIFTL